MSFNPSARLDPGQITDRRGLPGGRGGVALGGGGLGIVVLVVYLLLGGNPSDQGAALQPGAVVGPESTVLATDCQTGQDANERDRTDDERRPDDRAGGDRCPNPNCREREPT